MLNHVAELFDLPADVVAGLMLRGRTPDVRRARPKQTPLAPPPSFASAFVASVRNAATGMLSVCAFVVLFYVLASPLKSLGGTWGPLLVGVLELFSLTPLLTADVFGFILAAGCAGWGGLSVMAQTAAVLDGTDLPLRPCLTGKALQGFLSALLAAVLTQWLS